MSEGPPWFPNARFGQFRNETTSDVSSRAQTETQGAIRADSIIQNVIQNTDHYLSDYANSNNTRLPSVRMESRGFHYFESGMVQPALLEPTYYPNLNTGTVESSYQNAPMSFHPIQTLNSWGEAFNNRIFNTPQYYSVLGPKSDNHLRKDLILKNQSSDLEFCSESRLKPLLPTDGACIRIAPLLKKARPDNYCQLLVGILREYSHHISLIEFYDLLYRSPTSGIVTSGSFNCESSISPAACSLKAEDLRVCSFVIETFRRSIRSTNKNIPAVDKTNMIGSVCFEEFLRTFLAIKILLDSIQKIEEPSENYKAIPRMSIYKAYCMIFQKLSSDSLKNIHSNGWQKAGILGNSKLGKVIKAVYPDLAIRRLGRRGESKHHCLGITWNKLVVDADMIRSLDLDTPKSVVRLMNVHRKKSKASSNTESKTEESPNTVSPDMPLKMIKPIQAFEESGNSSYSFVDFEFKLPETGCSPRVWKVVEGSYPQPSRWTLDALSKSVLGLKQYQIDSRPIIDSFHDDIFSRGVSNAFSKKFLHQMTTLVEGDFDSKGYLHLYHTVLLLFFPLILSTNEEVTHDAKVVLRKNMKTFVSELMLMTNSLPQREMNTLTNFLNIIRKMIHISEMSQTIIKPSLTKRVTEEIGLDFKRPCESTSGLGHNLAKDEIVFTAVSMACNAHRKIFDTESAKLSLQNSYELVKKVALAYQNYMVEGIKCLTMIPQSMTPQILTSTGFDLPFRIFKNFSEAFHKTFLSDPFVLKLPAPVIKQILVHIDKELQALSFQKYSERNTEISKDTFKTWWICAVLVEEYMQILSEVAALSARLECAE